MVGLFASDLDGTLFGITHQAGREVLSSVRMACDSGRHFALATGRTVRSSEAVGFGDVPVEVICANGAIMLGRDGSVIRHVPMDPAFIEELLVAFPELPLEFVTLDHTLERRSREEFEAARRRLPLIRRIVMRGMTRDNGERLYGQTSDAICSQEVVKVNYRTEPGDDEVRERLASFVTAHAGQAVNAPFSRHMFEITDPSATKAEGVAWLARHLGLTNDEVAVYGDGGNDLSMLRRFEHSYAPRGALEEAKRAANVVIGSNVLHAVPRHVKATVRHEGTFWGASEHPLTARRPTP